MALTNFQGGCIWNFQGVLRHFQGGFKKILGGRGLRFFQEDWEFFTRGWDFSGRGWDLVRVFEIVPVMVMLFLGRGSFSGRLRFFREGFKFFEGWRCFRKCLGIFGRGWDYFRGVEFIQGIWKISGGGEIFSGWLISIFMCMGRLKLSKGG